jgi:hypothetical protein
MGRTGVEKETIYTYVCAIVRHHSDMFFVGSPLKLNQTQKGISFIHQLISHAYSISSLLNAYN